MRLFDVWIDFVNLRAEDYSENSRIPTTMRFGTAEEDAYRRDLTINRLCVAYMDLAWRLLQLIGSSSITDDQRRLCLYSALLLPLRNAVYRDKKGKMIPVVSYIFRTSLKSKISDAETVLSMHRAAENFFSLIPITISDENLQIIEVDEQRETIDVPLASKCRIWTGLLLREIKEFWRPSLALSLLLYPQDIVSSTNPSSADAELNERRALFDRAEKNSGDGAGKSLGIETTSGW